MLRLIEPIGGRILIEGEDVTDMTPEQMRPFRRRVQMVFQDPYASLNPRLSAAEIVTEPLENFERLSAAERRERAAALLATGRAAARTCWTGGRSSSPAASASAWALPARSACGRR